MKLSILTVTTDRDKTYNNLLVKSIKETISLKEQDYEIIIHDSQNRLTDVWSMICLIKLLNFV